MEAVLAAGQVLLADQLAAVAQLGLFGRVQLVLSPQLTLVICNGLFHSNS
jgi:hypothetical protein